MDALKQSIMSYTENEISQYPSEEFLVSFYPKDELTEYKQHKQALKIWEIASLAKRKTKYIATIALIFVSTLLLLATSPDVRATLRYAFSTYSDHVELAPTQDNTTSDDFTPLSISWIPDEFKLMKDEKDSVSWYQYYESSNDEFLSFFVTYEDTSSTSMDNEHHVIYQESIGTFDCLIFEATDANSVNMIMFTHNGLRYDISSSIDDIAILKKIVENIQ